mmetsp:Transcript_9061/g.13589  ORF Transcript_9061/g.13589 Transcript_9061/m.13589 type:complete len:357 (+) Transcript_9061:73-1143(+)
MTSHVAPSANSFWNQQEVLETVRKLTDLSGQEKTVLLKMVESQNAEIASLIESSMSAEELKVALVALARQQGKDPVSTAESKENGKLETVRHDINVALMSYDDNKASIQTSSLKAIQKILQRVQKKPSDIRNRRLQLTNIVVKKFITSVKGASELVKACGYLELEIGAKKTKYLVMKDVNLDNIKLALELIQQKLRDVKAGKKSIAVPKPKPKRILCKCGFWGNIETKGLCSVCYRKEVFGEPDKAEEKKAEAKKKAKKSWKIGFKRATTKLAAIYRFRRNLKTDSRLIQKNKKRCFTCNKKVGYLGFECRCMFVFCELHRLPESHNCRYDFKRRHMNKLKKDNKVVAHDKLSKLE